MMTRLRYLLLPVLALWACVAAAQTVAVPPLQARVTDLTGTLTRSEQAALEQKLASFEAQKGSQVVVLLLPTTGEESLAEYGIRVADAWKIGRKGVDDGAILLVALQDRQMRIEVGYGLEGALPDAVAKRIVSDLITPYFKRGDYYTGIATGVDAIIAAVSGEALPAPPRRSQEVAPDTAGRAFGIAMAGIFIGMIVRAVSNRGAGAVAGGLSAVLLGFLVAGLGIALLAALIAFVFVLAGGSPGMGYSSRRGGFGGGFGGGYGGGFGGNRGGGGFRGGGGGFGGGGASGGW